jgi:hypothetical protein
MVSPGWERVRSILVAEGAAAIISLRLVRSSFYFEKSIVDFKVFRFLS